MKNRKEKIAFGIFQDGLTVRVAQLVSTNNIIRIQRLEEIVRSIPLYTKESTELNNGLEPRESEIDIAEVSEYDSETLNLPEISEYDDTSDTEEIKKEEVSSGIEGLKNLLDTFPIEKGKIALSANDEQISYYQFDSVFSATNLKKNLKSEILSKEELKSKNYELGYFTNPNKSILAFVHRGKFELLNAFQDINAKISKKEYFYSFIDTNEISLMNLVRNNYDFPPEDYVLILYIDVDYRVGIVMKGKAHIKTFPIIVTESDPEGMRQAIYSKVILEQDVANIPITQHVIIAGKNVQDEDVAFFKEKVKSDSTITRLELKNVDLTGLRDDKLLPVKIARFAIPISLAWKTLDPKNKNFIHSNLLNSKIIESQKHFKVAWHGFLIFIAIFYFAFSGTVKNQQVKEKIVETGRINYNLELELNRYRSLATKISEVTDRINILKKSLIKVEELPTNKNQWHYILKVLSNSLSKNRISWISCLKSGDKDFQISGFTTRRKNLISFSKLFPDCKMAKVSNIEIQGVPVLEFDISFLYPDSIRIPKRVEAKSPSAEIREADISFEEGWTTAAKDYQKIVLTYLSGNLNEAFEKFSQFVKRYPDDPLVYNVTYLIGECLFQMDKISEAKAIFENTVKHEGNLTPEALMMLGRCANREHNTDKAIEYWDRLIKEYPDNNLAELAENKIKVVRSK